MKKWTSILGLTGVILTGFSTSLLAVTVSVPGTADIFVAGLNANGGSPGGGT